MKTSNVWALRLSNWGCGALTVAVSLTLGSQVLRLYGALAARVPWRLHPSIGLTVAVFLALDLLYYLQHRAEHRVPWLWRIHAVHHQSTLCDTSVSLRTSMLAPLTVLTAHLVLAVAGVPLEVYLPLYLAHTGFVFLLHARTPRWLDRAGWLFNSPFVHRAHHSSEPRFRGKNFGGVLVLWDRCFGTFEPDCAEVGAFGLPGRATPLNPLVANFGQPNMFGRRR